MILLMHFTRCQQTAQHRISRDSPRLEIFLWSRWSGVVYVRTGTSITGGFSLDCPRRATSSSQSNGWIAWKLPAKYSTIVSIFFTDGYDLLYRATRTCSTRGPLFNGRRISRGGEGYAK